MIRKFRGKAKDGGEWLFGMPITNKLGTYIVYEENSHYCGVYNYMEIDELGLVDEETVGQFTGLIDKKGKEIYEGDIIDVAGFDKGVVEFDYGVFGINWDYNRKDGRKAMLDVWGQLHNLRTMDDEIYQSLEVIGNIYDNKKLLET